MVRLTVNGSVSMRNEQLLEPRFEFDCSFKTRKGLGNDHKLLKTCVKISTKYNVASQDFLKRI